MQTKSLSSLKEKKKKKHNTLMNFFREFDPIKNSPTRCGSLRRVSRVPLIYALKDWNTLPWGKRRICIALAQQENNNESNAQKANHKDSFKNRSKNVKGIFSIQDEGGSLDDFFFFTISSQEQDWFLHSKMKGLFNSVEIYRGWSERAVLEGLERLKLGRNGSCKRVSLVRSRLNLTGGQFSLRVKLAVILWSISSLTLVGYTHTDL